jgi:hypothetical protein
MCKRYFHDMKTKTSIPKYFFPLLQSNIHLSKRERKGKASRVFSNKNNRNSRLFENLNTFDKHWCEAMSITPKYIPQQSEQFHNTVKLLISTASAASPISTTI